MNVSIDTPFVWIGFAANDFCMVGATIALSDALADPPAPELVPPSTVEMKPLTLACGPAVVAVTFTLTVHDALAGNVAPVGCPKTSDVDPGAGAQLGEPPHVVVADGAPDTWSPAGSESENWAPVRAALFGFVSVNVSVDVPFTAIALGENAFVSVGCAGEPQPVNAMLS